MAQSVSQIQHDIENTKTHISQTVNELEDRFQELKDWKSTVYRYPLMSLGVSIGLGLLVSGVFKPKLIQYGGKVITGTLTGVLVQALKGAVRGEYYRPVRF